MVSRLPVAISKSTLKSTLESLIVLNEITDNYSNIKFIDPNSLGQTIYLSAFVAQLLIALHFSILLCSILF